jgi:hypothetical protein
MNTEIHKNKDKVLQVQLAYLKIAHQVLKQLSPTGKIKRRSQKNLKVVF